MRLSGRPTPGSRFPLAYVAGCDRFFHSRKASADVLSFVAGALAAGFGFSWANRVATGKMQNNDY